MSVGPTLGKPRFESRKCCSNLDTGLSGERAKWLAGLGEIQIRTGFETQYYDMMKFSTVLMFGGRLITVIFSFLSVRCLRLPCLWHWVTDAMLCVFWTKFIVTLSTVWKVNYPLLVCKIYICFYCCRNTPKWVWGPEVDILICKNAFCLHRNVCQMIFTMLPSILLLSMGFRESKIVTWFPELVFLVSFGLLLWGCFGNFVKVLFFLLTRVCDTF